MHVDGAEANDVVRADEPSSAGHGVAPLSVAPSAAAGGVIPFVGNVVDVGAVVVVAGFDEDDEREPRKAPSVESTTMTATAPAATCLRRRSLRWRAVKAACAFWRANCCCRRSEVRAMVGEPTSDSGSGRGGR